jgi:hypothetical protein
VRVISSRVLFGNDLLHMCNGFDIFVAGKSIEQFAIAEGSILLDREEEVKGWTHRFGRIRWAP